MSTVCKEGSIHQYLKNILRYPYAREQTPKLLRHDLQIFAFIKEWKCKGSFCTCTKAMVKYRGCICQICFLLLHAHIEMRYYRWELWDPEVITGPSRILFFLSYRKVTSVFWNLSFWEIETSPYRVNATSDSHEHCQVFKIQSINVLKP